ncbi:hypothetical protein [Mesonia aquimarina]|uniref:hypothetical protein n=1 Tax=Mesonia aquimarina TaxID=1504967 RepID=UPI000EF5C7B9|nr:hypothetical protein [Mesonia aquimarina]
MKKQFNIQLEDKSVIKKVNQLAADNNCTPEEMIERMVKASTIIMKTSEQIKRLDEIFPAPSFVPGGIVPGEYSIETNCAEDFMPIKKWETFTKEELKIKLPNRNPNQL